MGSTNFANFALENEESKLIIQFWLAVGLAAFFHIGIKGDL